MEISLLLYPKFLEYISVMAHLSAAKTTFRTAPVST